MSRWDLSELITCDSIGKAPTRWYFCELFLKDARRLLGTGKYYLPYKDGELEKIVFYSDHHSSMIWRLNEKDPTLEL